MTIFLVDDEIAALETAQHYLAEFFPDIEITGTAESVKDAVKCIKKLKPSIVLLDIELRDGTGFDILKAFPNPKFKVIFVTAFDNFAVQAFRFSAVDYLLKPINPLNFQEAIKRAIEYDSASNQQIELLTLLHNLSSRSDANKRIVLRTSDDIHLIDISEIIRVESDGAYSIFIIHGGKKITVSQHLKHYDEILSGYGFFRCHQSHIVNVSYIVRFHKTEGGTLILKDGSSVPVSSRKRESVVHLIEHQGIH